MEVGLWNSLLVLKFIWLCERWYKKYSTDQLFSFAKKNPSFSLWRFIFRGYAFVYLCPWTLFYCILRSLICWHFNFWVLNQLILSSQTLVAQLIQSFHSTLYCQQRGVNGYSFIKRLIHRFLAKMVQRRNWIIDFCCQRF